MIIAWVGERTVDYKRGNVLPTIILSALPLFLIAALRYGVGTDYFYTYVPYFNLLEAGIDPKDKEPLFKLLNHIIIFFNGSSQWVFVFCGLMFTYLSYSQIFKDSPYPWLSILLLLGMTYYFISLNAVRQMIGASILLYSIRFIESKSLKKFLLCVLAAAGFHYSCSLFIVVYLAAKLKLNLTKSIILSTLFLALFLLIKDYVLEAIRITSYGWYLGSKFDNGKLGYFTLAIQFVVFLFSSVTSNLTCKYRIYLNLQLISLLLATISSVIVLLERVRWLFGLPSIILLPLAISNIQNKRVRLMTGALIAILFSIYAFYTIGIKNGHEVLPYMTIFEI